MKQQRAPARRRLNTLQAFFGGIEPNFDVTYLTPARGGEEVAVHEVDRKRTHPVLDLV